MTDVMGEQLVREREKRHGQGGEERGRPARMCVVSHTRAQQQGILQAIPSQIKTECKRERERKERKKKMRARVLEEEEIEEREREDSEGRTEPNPQGWLSEARSERVDQRKKSLTFSQR